MIALVAGGVATVAESEDTGFRLDLSPEELARARSTHILDDLVVGDTGRIDSDYVCFEEGALFIDPLAELQDEDGVQWYVTIEPNQRASVSIQSRANEPVDPGTALNEIDNVLIWLSCASYRRTFMLPDHFLRITEINGFSSLSEIAEAGEAN